MKPPRKDDIAETPNGMLAISGGFKLSALVNGNRLFAEEMGKSIRKSRSLGSIGEETDDDQALRRYDFARSSMRRA
jgi:hypothetical protein